MTNIGDGGVQLKIDSFEKNLLKCKKMISYYLQLNYHQDSNKLSKKETENERSENVEKIEMTPVNNNVLRLILNIFDQFSEKLDDANLRCNNMEFKLKTKECQVQEFLRVNSQSYEYIQQLTDKYRTVCQENTSLSQSMAVMHNQYQDPAMLLLQLTSIYEGLRSKENIANSNETTTENLSIQQTILSTAAHSVPATQLCSENSVSLVTQYRDRVQVSQPTAESVPKIFTLPKNRYKHKTNQTKEISGSEIEKSRFVEKSEMLKSSFVSGYNGLNCSNMTQLKRKSDFETSSVNFRSSKCFKPRIESYKTLEYEASKSTQCYPEKFYD